MNGNQIKIYCENISSYLMVEGGQSLQDIYLTIADKIGFVPVNARVNNKAEDLNYRVYWPKTVEYMSVTSDTGNRTYIRSLCMMLYAAVHHYFPEAILSIEHSVSRGYYCRVKGEGIPEGKQLAEKCSAYMNEMVAQDMKFERCEERTPDVIELFRRQKLYDKALLLETLRQPYTVYYRLGEICDSYYGALAPSTGILKTFSLIPYKEGLLLLGPSKEAPEIPNQPIPQEKMYQAFTDYLAFNDIIGVKNVGELNRAVSMGESSMLINVSEALHNNRIATIADEITRRFKQGGAKVVMVAGPSSSGKTTFTKRLAIQLMTNLLKPKMISLDDYFVDRHHTPIDETGDYDYESLYALDLGQFNRDLNDLVAGRTVSLPYYNFETGAREYRGNDIRLEDDSILLIEGIHGLNPELTAQVDERLKYRIYVSALTTISIDDHNWIPTTDNRLLRRIIRDARYRGVSPEETIRRWPSVRRGEEKWIFPYQENADAMFNSSLLFELGVMKPRGEELLSRVPHDVVEYAEAARLKRFLGYFQAIAEEHIPSTSLLREFLGGSSFHY